MTLGYERIPEETRTALAGVIKSPDIANILNLIAEAEFDQLPRQIRTTVRKMYRTPPREMRPLTYEFAEQVLNYINGKI